MTEWNWPKEPAEAVLVAPFYPGEAPSDFANGDRYHQRNYTDTNYDDLFVSRTGNQMSENYEYRVSDYAEENAPSADYSEWIPQDEVQHENYSGGPSVIVAPTWNLTNPNVEQQSTQPAQFASLSSSSGAGGLVTAPLVQKTNFAAGVNLPKSIKNRPVALEGVAPISTLGVQRDEPLPQTSTIGNDWNAGSDVDDENSEDFNLNSARGAAALQQLTSKGEDLLGEIEQALVHGSQVNSEYVPPGEKSCFVGIEGAPEVHTGARVLLQEIIGLRNLGAEASRLNYRLQMNECKSKDLCHRALLLLRSCLDQCRPRGRVPYQFLEDLESLASVTKKLSNCGSTNPLKKMKYLRLKAVFEARFQSLKLAEDRGWL